MDINATSDTETGLFTVSPEEPSAGGRGEDEAATDRRAEARHLARVRAAVKDYMKGRRKRNGRY